MNTRQSINQNYPLLCPFLSSFSFFPPLPLFLPPSHRHFSPNRHDRIIFHHQLRLPSSFILMFFSTVLIRITMIAWYTETPAEIYLLSLPHDLRLRFGSRSWPTHSGTSPPIFSCSRPPLSRDEALQSSTNTLVPLVTLGRTKGLEPRFRSRMENIPWKHLGWEIGSVSAVFLWVLGCPLVHVSVLQPADEWSLASHQLWKRWRFSASSWIPSGCQRLVNAAIQQAAGTSQFCQALGGTHRIGNSFESQIWQRSFDLRKCFKFKADELPFGHLSPMVQYKICWTFMIYDCLCK